MVIYEELHRFGIAGLSQGACRGQTEVFFCTNKRKEVKQAAESKARILCRMCQVRWLCAGWALDIRYEEQGIWGGFTQKQRESLQSNYPDLVEEYVMLVRGLVHIQGLQPGVVSEIDDEEGREIVDMGFAEEMPVGEVPDAMLQQMDEAVGNQ